MTNFDHLTPTLMQLFLNVRVGLSLSFRDRFLLMYQPPSVEYQAFPMVQELPIEALEIQATAQEKTSLMEGTVR